jgi:hypothetical protein
MLHGRQITLCAGSVVAMLVDSFAPTSPAIGANSSLRR